MNGRDGRFTFAALLALLFLLPWPWGSTQPAAQAAFGCAVTVLAAFAVLWPSAATQAPACPQVLRRTARIFAALWIVWLALQLLPLPRSWLALLSPEAAAIHGAVDIATGRAWNSLAIAPGKAFDGLLLSLGYVLFYLLVLNSCGTSRRRQSVLAVIVASGCLQAIYASYMTSSGIEFGFFAPKTSGLGSASGTFVDRDHFAAYLELALAAGTGLMLAAAGPLRSGLLRRVPALLSSWTLTLRATLLTMVVALVLSHSRMGNTAFAAALTACAALYLIWHPGHRRFGLLLFVSIAVIDVLLVSDRFGLAAVVDRLQGTRLDQEARTLVLQQLLPVIKHHALWGAGLGGFEYAFAPWRPLALTGYFDHAHNDYAELLIDAGVPGLILLAGFIGAHLLHLLRILRRGRDAATTGTAFAVLLATVSVAIHAAADFVLQIPAIAASLLALLAVGMSQHETGPVPIVTG